MAHFVGNGYESDECSEYDSGQCDGYTENGHECVCICHDEMDFESTGQSRQWHNDMIEEARDAWMNHTSPF